MGCATACDGGWIETSLVCVGEGVRDGLAWLVSWGVTRGSLVVGGGWAVDGLEVLGMGKEEGGEGFARGRGEIDGRGDGRLGLWEGRAGGVEWGCWQESKNGRSGGGGAELGTVVQGWVLRSLNNLGNLTLPYCSDSVIGLL